MENESTTKLVSSNMKRTLLIFSIGGLSLHYVVYTIYFTYKIVLHDFLPYDPYRSLAHSIELLLRSPIHAILGVLFSVFPVIVATIIAVVSHRIWRRIPFYIIIVMIPLCGFLFLHSMRSMLPNFGPDYSNDIMDVFWISLRELPVWVGCWWLSNRTPKIKVAEM